MFMQKIEKTLGILKPDILRRNLQHKVLEEIKSHFHDIHGFKMEDSEELVLTKEQAMHFYDEHKDKGFFNEMVRFMTNGPVIIFLLEGENIIKKYRNFIGATDPKKADHGTLRSKYGISIDENSFHGSDSLEAAAREISFFQQAIQKKIKH
jgi:nucleoside-diphosphate kinase